MMTDLSGTSPWRPGLSGPFADAMDIARLLR